MDAEQDSYFKPVRHCRANRITNGMTIEVDRNIQTRQLIMVASFRIAIGAFGTRSTATHTGLLYNHTL